jgi:hypothetical protein
VDAGSQALAVGVAAVPGMSLAWAGMLKLSRPFAASVALVRFGLARRVRPAFGRVAGAVELAAGALLVALPFSGWAYVLPTALLFLFVVLIGRALLRHERFSCGCFGADEADTIGVWTLARALAFLGLCMAALAWALRGSPSGIEATTRLDAVAAACVALAATQLALTIRSTNPFTD